jgi:hypothetical protein
MTCCKYFGSDRALQLSAEAIGGSSMYEYTGDRVQVLYLVSTK